LYAGAPNLIDNVTNWATLQNTNILARPWLSYSGIGRGVFSAGGTRALFNQPSLNYTALSLASLVRSCIAVAAQ